MLLPLLQNLLEGVSLPAPAVQGGGIGHGRQKKKTSHVWMEKDGEILVFRNATDASIYLQQQKPEPVVNNVKRLKVRKAEIKPLEKIDLSVIENHKERLKQAIPEFISIEQAKQDIALLLHLARQAWEWQDEEDVELLLLAA